LVTEYSILLFIEINDKSSVVQQNNSNKKLGTLQT